MLGRRLVAVLVGGGLLSAIVLTATWDRSREECIRRQRATGLAKIAERTLGVTVEGAIQRYTEALDLDPDNPHIWFGLANANERRGNWPEVVRAATKATDLSPEHATHWAKLGLAQLRSAEVSGAARAPSATRLLEQATASFKQCLSRDPHLADCHFWLGESYERLGNRSGASRHYSGAIAADPTRAEYYVALARLYVVIDAPRAAEQVVRESQRHVDPSASNQRHRIRLQLIRARAAERRGDFDSRLHALEAGHALGSDGAYGAHLQVQLQLGVAYAQSGPDRQAQAERILRAAFKRGCKRHRDPGHDCLYAQVYLRGLEQ